MAAIFVIVFFARVAAAIVLDKLSRRRLSPKITLPSYSAASVKNEGPKVREVSASAELDTAYVTAFAEFGSYVARSLYVRCVQEIYIDFFIKHINVLCCTPDPNWWPCTSDLLQILEACIGSSNIVDVGWVSEKLKTTNIMPMSISNPALSRMKHEVLTRHLSEQRTAGY